MKKKTEWKRKCPKCGEELSYTRKFNRDYAEIRNTNCLSCAKRGIKRNPFTEETRKRMSENHSDRTGKNHHMYGKFGENNPNYGQKRSEEARKNMRLSAIKRIEKNKFNGNQIIPGYNPNAIPIIKEYERKHGFNFQHAENGGEVCIGGYWPDGVDEKRKIIIEVDEKHHFNSNGNLKQKDIQRQKYLEGLGYKFIRIKIKE